MYIHNQPINFDKQKERSMRNADQLSDKTRKFN
jgi:hypothetical protein